MSDRTTWIIFGIGFVWLAVAFISLLRRPGGRTAARATRLAIRDLRGVRTWLVLTGEAVALFFTILIAGVAVSDSGFWAGVAILLPIDYWFARALVRRRRHARLHDGAAQIGVMRISDD
jgi:hypothetical protein